MVGWLLILLVLVFVFGEDLFQSRRGYYRRRRSGRTLRFTILSMGAICSLSLLTVVIEGFYRLPPWEMKSLSELEPVSIFPLALLILVATLVCTTFNRLLLGRTWVGGATDRTFYRTICAVLFAAGALGTGALLFGPASRIPTLDAPPARVVIFSDAPVTQATVVVAPVDPMGGVAPSPIDYLESGLLIQLSLEGEPDSIVRYGIAIDLPNAHLTSYHPHQYVNLSKADSLSFGTVKDGACQADEFRQSSTMIPFQSGVLSTGSVRLSSLGRGGNEYNLDDRITWHSAGSGKSHVRLPEVRLHGPPTDQTRCWHGLGAFEGEWMAKAIPEVTASLVTYVGSPVPPDAQISATPETIGRPLRWAQSRQGPISTYGSQLYLAPIYEVRTSRTQDAGNTSLFLSALLAGSGLTVLYEVIREMPPKKISRRAGTSKRMQRWTRPRKK